MSSAHMNVTGSYLNKLNTEVIAASFPAAWTVTLSLSVLSLFWLESPPTAAVSFLSFQKQTVDFFSVTI